MLSSTLDFLEKKPNWFFAILVSSLNICSTTSQNFIVRVTIETEDCFIKEREWNLGCCLLPMKPGYRHGHGHRDAAKLRNIGHESRHVYTYYFQTFN